MKAHCKFTSEINEDSSTVENRTTTNNEAVEKSNCPLSNVANEGQGIVNAQIVQDVVEDITNNTNETEEKKLTISSEMPAETTIAAEEIAHKSIEQSAKSEIIVETLLPEEIQQEIATEKHTETEVVTEPLGDTEPSMESPKEENSKTESEVETEIQTEPTIPIEAEKPTEPTTTIEAEAPTEPTPPIEAETPTEPTTTIEAETPTEPTPPIEAETPTEPTTTIEAETPTEPTPPIETETSTEPTPPIEAETPTEPTPPIEAETPTEPTTTIEAETPTEPTTTIEAETPTEPTPPIETETSTEPTPPIEPETPTEPTIPIEAETPTEPTSPIEIETPTEPNTPLEAETPVELIAPIEGEAVTELQVDAITSNKPPVKEEESEQPEIETQNLELEKSTEVTKPRPRTDLNDSSTLPSEDRFDKDIHFMQDTDLGVQVLDLELMLGFTSDEERSQKKLQSEQLVKTHSLEQLVEPQRLQESELEIETKEPDYSKGSEQPSQPKELIQLEQLKQSETYVEKRILEIQDYENKLDLSLVWSEHAVFDSSIQENLFGEIFYDALETEPEPTTKADLEITESQLFYSCTGLVEVKGDTDAIESIPMYDSDLMVEKIENDYSDDDDQEEDKNQEAKGDTKDNEQRGEEKYALETQKEKKRGKKKSTPWFKAIEETIQVSSVTSLYATFDTELPVSKKQIKESKYFKKRPWYDEEFVQPCNCYLSQYPRNNRKQKMTYNQVQEVFRYQPASGPVTFVSSQKQIELENPSLNVEIKKLVQQESMMQTKLKKLRNKIILMRKQIRDLQTNSRSSENIFREYRFDNRGLIIMKDDNQVLPPVPATSAQLLNELQRIIRLLRDRIKVINVNPQIRRQIARGQLEIKVTKSEFRGKSHKVKKNVRHRPVSSKKSNRSISSNSTRGSTCSTVSVNSLASMSSRSSRTSATSSRSNRSARSNRSNKSARSNRSNKSARSNKSSDSKISNTSNKSYRSNKSTASYTSNRSNDSSIFKGSSKHKGTIKVFKPQKRKPVNAEVISCRSSLTSMSSINSYVARVQFQ